MNHTDLILINGKILSVTLQGERIKGTAVAVKDGRILDIGDDDAIKALAAEDTKVIDCKGNTILPGLSDVHCHTLMGATELAGVNLFGTYVDEEHTADDVIEDIKGRIAAYMKQHPEATVIRGMGWVYQTFNPEERFPSRKDLDVICPDLPVVLNSFCHHFAWANTKALEMAGIDENTPDTVTGEILRDETGYPTGIFCDVEAINLLQNRLKEYAMTEKEIENALLDYQTELLSYGITLINDCMAPWNYYESIKRLYSENKLSFRTRGVYHLTPDAAEKLDEFIARKGKDNIGEDFRIDTVKMFAEGQFALIDGYLPEFCQANGLPEGFNGELYWDDELFTASAAKAMDAGFNVHVHAMGDKAVKQSAECLAKAQDIAGKKPRNIIAHVMLVPDETAKLMGDEEIIANVQPGWMMYENDVAGCIAMMGEKGDECYPYRKFLENGVITATGTDFPVNSQATMPVIQTAVTRSVYPEIPGYEGFKDKQLGTEEPATLEEIIQTMTINSAYQCFLEDETGSIEKGKSAELVVLDADLEAIDPHEIWSVSVDKTIYKGNIVYTK